MSHASGAGRSAGASGAELAVSLITRGASSQLTGGHLYQRRMAEAAAARGASLRPVPASPLRDPLRGTAGVVVVDSICAWSVAPWVLARRRRPPLVAIVHQPPGGVGRGSARTAVQRWLDQALYRRCDLVIAVSAALADQLARRRVVRRERICVVEPGSDVPDGQEAGQPGVADLRLGRKIAVLSVGTWHAGKGLLELLDAVAALAPGAVTLHLAGRDDADAGYTAQVRQRLSAPDLVDRVVAHGPVDPARLAGLYAAADVFALPSYAETYGTAYGEALRAGLPAVGWRAGNVPNLVDDGRQGYLVSPGDVVGLGAALARLASNDELRRSMAAAARQRGRSLPTWDEAADRFFAALKTLVARSG